MARTTWLDIEYIYFLVGVASLGDKHALQPFTFYLLSCTPREMRILVSDSSKDHPATCRRDFTRKKCCPIDSIATDNAQR